MREKWYGMTSKDKIMSLTRMIIIICYIVFGGLQFTGKVENTRNIQVPLFAIYLIISAIQKWNKDRDSASIYIVLAIVAVVITLAIWIG